MRPVHCLVTALLTLAACAGPVSDAPAAPTPAAATPAADDPRSEPAIFGTTHYLPSAIYGMDREINIYVPDIPEWGKGYFADPLPVLFLVDGGRDQDFFHIAGLSQLTLVNAERQPMIVVGVRTHDRRPEISPAAEDPRYKANGFEGWGGSHTFRRHLLEEVRPFVESRHATGRATLMGESLAGLFVVETFLEAPGSFDDYVAVSPSLWWDDRRLSRQAPERLASHGSSDRRLYLTMADEGGTMQLGLDELLVALSAHPDTVDVRYVDRSGEDTHGTIYHHAARDALTWLHGIPAGPYGETPWYLVEGGQPDATPPPSELTNPEEGTDAP